jgi:hypothetical protein
MYRISVQKNHSCATFRAKLRRAGARATKSARVHCCIARAIFRRARDFGLHETRKKPRTGRPFQPSLGVCPFAGIWEKWRLERYAARGWAGIILPLRTGSLVPNPATSNRTRRPAYVLESGRFLAYRSGPLHQRAAVGGSSNGRTADSDSAYLGSNPSPPAT